MIRLWRSLKARLLLLVYGEPLPPIPVPEPTPPRAAPLRLSKEATQSEGEFYFKDTILDKLDHYFHVLPVLKGHDPEAYELFSRIGAQVIPGETLFLTDRQFKGASLKVASPAERWVESRPMAGAVLFGWEDSPLKSLKVYPKLMYFHRFKPKTLRNEGFEPLRPGEALYVGSVFFAELNDKKLQGVANYAVAIDKVGCVRPLKNLMVGQRLPSKGKHLHLNPKKRDRGPEWAPTRRWGFPKAYRDWARECGDHTPEAFIARLFESVVQAWTVSTESSMTRVMVSKGDVTAAFAVNILRTPYFFRDRDVQTNRKKKIFHIVRVHERHLGDGRVTTVRTHFRGERKFDWNGYAISISVPGWHFNSLLNASIAARVIPEEEFVPDGRFYDAAQTGELIAEVIRA